MAPVFVLSMRLYLFRGFAAALTLLALAGSARAETAEEAPAPPPAKGGYHLFRPTPRELMRDMSTDRPDTTESAYTVDAGHFQIELSFVDFNRDHNNEASETTRTFAYAPVLLKAGLLNWMDLQIGLDPFTWEKTTDRKTRESETVRGFGDTVVRLKVNLWGNDGGSTALAVMPFVKLPTARRELGNGNVEGGLIVPLAVELPCEFGLGVMLEIDVIRSGDDDRYIVDLVQTVTVSRDLFGNLGGYVELAGFASLHAEEDFRAYFDAGLTYALTPDIQLDGGVRLGLTKAADDFGAFVGMSVRF